MQLTFNIFSIVSLGLLSIVGILFSAALAPSSIARAQSAAESENLASPELTAKEKDKPKKSWDCTPTKPDSLGPFYQPSAPVRSSVDSGYVLSGTVKSTSNCSPVDGVRIEFWLANPDGEYDEAHRATIFSNESGAYWFESNFPPPYGSRPSHIHVRVTAEGFKPLITQHYPVAGRTEATFDLVLIPLEYRGRSALSFSHPKVF